jgi:hypothetical protein
VQGVNGVVPFSVAVPGPSGPWKFQLRAQRLLLLLYYPKDALESIPRLCVVTERAKTRFCSAGSRRCRSVLGCGARALRSVGVQTREQRPERICSAAHRGPRGEQKDAQGGVQVAEWGVRVSTERCLSGDCAEQACWGHVALIAQTFVRFES